MYTLAKATFQGGSPKEVAMRGTIRGAILRMLLAFFAGAITMLFFLSPGEIRMQDLLDREKRTQVADFDQAADRVEKANTLALYYAGRAKQYIKDRLQ